MTYQPLENAFNFSKYHYEVAFEIVETGFFEKLFTKKRTKNKYYIRQSGRGREHILYVDNTAGSFGYRFIEMGTAADYWTLVYFNNPTEPQELLTKMVYINKPNNDNVVFSTRELIEAS
jgi:hypothetical protein